MLCGRFSLQDLANIASEIPNKTLRFLYQRVGTICSQYFHSRISSDINYGKYPVCKLTFEKLLISDFYFYVERWWETTIDWLFLLVTVSPTSEDLRWWWDGRRSRPDQTRPAPPLSVPPLTSGHQHSQQEQNKGFCEEPTAIHQHWGRRGRKKLVQ